MTAKSSELEQLRGKLQDSLAAEATLSDKIAYLYPRATDFTGAPGGTDQNTEHLQCHTGTAAPANHNHQTHNQNLTAERDQLHSELASRDEQLAALQSELQAATQALAQARSRASTAGEALSTARVQVGMYRDELTKLEA